MNTAVLPPPQLSLRARPTAMSSRPSADLEVEAPSLQLQDVEGRIHQYEGLLSRRTRKAKLKRWKKRWFRVAPDHRQQNLYNLSQSKSTEKERVKVQKLVVSRIPRTEPDIKVDPLTQDPHSRDFTTFTVKDSVSNIILGTFRADDIVQQRNFMAALGGCGPGLFTQNAGDVVDNNDDVFDQEQTDLPSETGCELEARQMTYDCRVSCSSAAVVPSYENTLKQLPKEFYYPQTQSTSTSTTTENTRHSHSELQKYDPTQSHKQAKTKTCMHMPLQLAHQRTVTDTFLPPHGPANYCPVNLGTGEEVGLRPHQQAVWDTVSRSYYFLDHSAKTSFVDDPRPSNHVDKPATVKKEEVTIQCGSNCPVTHETTSRTCKPIGFVIHAAGRNGSAGVDGKKGVDGECGSSGAPGINSRDGEDGTDGSAATSGQHGKAGETGGRGCDIVLQLRGNSSALQLDINNKRSVVARLGGERNEEVILVDCRGGDGGSGGEGGVGGAGGSGGDGGKGGMKGNGGHGGDGGMGGGGGNGGAGGKGGSGGQCVVRTLDPCLLMLVDVDSQGGVGGKGGVSGTGGEGGRRGYGGEGGAWVEPDNSPNAAEGSVHTVRGMNGKPGSTGADGSHGTGGQDGITGKDGETLWVIESPSNDVIQLASSRYEATVTSLKISPPLCEMDAYEPNQLITVSDVVVTNTGGLSLPMGAKFFFPTTKTVRFPSKVVELPEILPGDSFTVPEEFTGRIFDQATPNLPGTFTGEASFSPRVELLGRPFETSLVQKLPVAYPVKLSFALSKKNIGRGEISVLEMGIENSSKFSSYGSASSCKGSLAMQLHLDSHLIPLGVQWKSVSESSENEPLPFKVTHQPRLCDSMWISVKELLPGDILCVPIAFLMDCDAQLCDTCIWQVDLHYKGKLVEYMAQEIRVTPAYTPPSPLVSLADVLMITSDLISGTEFALWQKIFDILDVNVDYWDISRKKDETEPVRTQAEGSSPTNSALRASSTSSSPIGQSAPTSLISAEPFNLYAGKTIIFPHCKLEQISANQIVSHFNSTSSSSDSNMLLFLSPEHTQSLEDYFYDHVGHSKILRHLCQTEDRVKLPDGAHSGYHLVAPGTVVSSDVAVKKSERKIMKKLEAEYPSHTLALVNRHGNINQRSLWKYSYGNMEIRRCPLRHSCNFQCVDGVGGSATAMGSDDPLLTAKSTEFPLASKFGQVFLAVLVSIPLKCKLNLFKTESSGSVKFHLPNGMQLDRKQLSAAAIAHVVADEILDCTGSISKMKQVMDDLQENRGLYVRNGAAPFINQMLSLIQLEVFERAQRSESSIVLRTAKEIQKLCKLCRILDTTATAASCENLLQANGKALQFRMNSMPVMSPLFHYDSHLSLIKPPSRTLSSTSRYNSTISLSPGSTRGSINSAFDFPHGSMGHMATEPGLPSMRILQDSVHVLRSHQLTINENCYDVSH